MRIESTCDSSTLSIRCHIYDIIQRGDGIYLIVDDSFAEIMSTREFRIKSTQGYSVNISDFLASIKNLSRWANGEKRIGGDGGDGGVGGGGCDGGGMSGDDVRRGRC